MEATYEKTDFAFDEYKDIVIKAEFTETATIPVEMTNETQNVSIKQEASDTDIVIKTETKDFMDTEDLHIKLENSEVGVTIKEEPLENAEFQTESVAYAIKPSFQVERFSISEVDLGNGGMPEQYVDVVIKNEMFETDDVGYRQHLIKQEDNESFELTDNSSATAKDKHSWKEFYKKIDNYFICLKCTDSPKFNNNVTITRHLKTDHYGITFKCDKCEKEYKTRNGLNYHLKICMQNLPVKDASEKNLQCRVKTENNNEECCSEPKRKTAKGPGERMNFANIYKKLGLRHFICQKCKISKKFPTRISVVRHIRIDHFHIKYKCIECKNEYRNKDALRTHLKEKHKIDIHQLKRGDCIVQNITDSSTESEGETVMMKMEIEECQASEDEEDYQARTADDIKLATKIRFCGESYKRLDDHEFLCLKCEEGSSKVYRHRKTVIDHVRYDHYGIRYKCPSCDKTSKDKGGLAKHLKRDHDIDIHKLRLRDYCYDSTECEQVLPD